MYTPKRLVDMDKYGPLTAEQVAECDSPEIYVKQSYV
jgi:hypothetical protein